MSDLVEPKNPVLQGLCRLASTDSARSDLVKTGGAKTPDLQYLEHRHYSGLH